MKYYKDKVAIVTGGASGIGRALCEELSNNGAIVTVADIDFEGARKAASSIKTTGGRAEAAKLDVTKQKDVEKLIKEIAKKHGSLDFMFNNAGIAVIGEIRDMDMEQWKRLIDINLMSVIYGTDAAYSVMVKQGSGHIINTSSQAGLFPFVGSNAYAVPKHGVVALSRGLRIEAASLGVKVSVVCPGPIQTNIFDSATMLKMENDDFFSMMKFELMSAAKAARIILKKVKKNKGIIIITLQAKFFRLLDRLSPTLLEKFMTLPHLYIRDNVRKG